MFFVSVLCLLKMASAAMVVQTTSGPIQGVTTLSTDVEAFLGIPFAEPPIGDLRFAKPVAKKPWTEILDASKLPPPCAQISLDFPYYFMPDVTNMTEDCLYLNIWAPKPLSYNKLRPVVIFLHSGAFYSGASCKKEYDGTNFAKRGDVIVVTINYRLGAFGFFLAYTEEAAGNMGIYDQILAMKWVKDNALRFGGNSENIVLMGASAGAMSISAHLTSPISGNLFQKAIIESGGIVHPFFFDNNTRVFQNSQQIANTVGCVNETVTLLRSPTSVVNCLKQQSVESIVKAEQVLSKTNAFTLYPRAFDEFLPQSGMDYLRNGKFNKDVPILTGFNNNEGSVLLLVAFPEYFGTFGDDISQSLSTRRASIIIRALMMLVNETNAAEIAKYYIARAKDKTSEENIKALADAAGDYLISCSTLFQADFFALNGNPVYFYKFGFRAASTPMAEWTGTVHLDEIQYVFGNPYHEDFTKEEAELSNRIIDRWSAFAWTGNPNIPDHVPWLTYSYDNPLYLNIEQEEESIRINPAKRCEIWRKRFRSEIDLNLIKQLKSQEPFLSQMTIL